MNGQQSDVQLAFRDAASFACITCFEHLIDQFLKWFASREDIALAAAAAAAAVFFCTVFVRHFPPFAVFQGTRDKIRKQI